MLEKLVKFRARMLNEEAIDHFLQHCRLFSHHTQLSYAGALRRFAGTTPKFICQIRTENVEQYLISLQKEHSAGTVNLHLTAIKSLYNFLEANYGTKNIARPVRRLRLLPPNQKIISREEYQRLKSLNTGKTRDCIVFLAMTGLRAAEYLSLTPANITDDFITIVGKGKRQRSIPLNRNVKSILSHYPHINFLKSTNYAALYRLCCRASQNAGIYIPYPPHSFRHYFATELHRAGIPIDVIAKLLGHSSSAITERVYIHWQLADLKGLTDCLE